MVGSGVVLYKIYDVWSAVTEKDYALVGNILEGTVKVANANEVLFEGTIEEAIAFLVNDTYEALNSRQ